MTTGVPGEGVDVARLMDEIKERVRQRQASGFYSEEVVRRITQMELEVTDALPGFRGELDAHLGVLNEGWDPTLEPVFTSHRRAVGALIVKAKWLLRRLTKPYITLVLARQAQFNSTLVHLLNAFVLPARESLAALTRKADELSLATHERLAAEHTEAQRRHREVSQQIERLAAELAALRALVDHVRPVQGAPHLPPAPVVPAGSGVQPADAYVAFEDRHRGTREDILARQRGYLELFGAGPILDVGCGRGEFLELCRDAGKAARGIDVDAAMVSRCREAGLDASQADALEHLAGLPDGSLTGVFCAQVIEHLPADAFIALVRLAHAKLRSGGILLCETPNPQCLTIFASAFYVDLTHLKPVHPEGARFVFEAAGFRDVQLQYVNPCPPESRLRPVEPFWYMRRYEEALLSVLNENVGRLNDLLWGAQDYAVIGRKP